MPQLKHALLLFSKPPVPGLVKTRLTEDKGGLFSPKGAADFFGRSLLDVLDSCQAAIEQFTTKNKASTVEFVVSTSPAENLALMQDFLSDYDWRGREVSFIVDTGSNFDEHFNMAFNECFKRGYDTVISVGGDIPLMPPELILTALEWLEYYATLDKGGLVMAPCQECGTSLVGWPKGTAIDHAGVYYNSSGRPALDAYVQKASDTNTPITILPAVPDIDDTQDLAHAISLVRAQAYSAKTNPGIHVPRRFLGWANILGLKSSTPPNEDRDSRAGIDE